MFSNDNEAFNCLSASFERNEQKQFSTTTVTKEHTPFGDQADQDLESKNGMDHEAADKEMPVS